MCDTDKNPCTIDTCVAGKCVRENAAAGGACNDEDACTINDACDGSGVCRGVLGCAQGCNEPHGQCCAGKCVCSAAFAGDVCDEQVSGCLVGAEACPCTSGGACDRGLSCSGGVCVVDEEQASVAAKNIVALMLPIIVMYMAML